MKSERLTITEEVRNEVTKCITFWYGDACVHGTKKPLFLDSDGDEITNVVGFEVNVFYEVKE